VLASDLLPERAIDGDPAARRQLIDEVYLPLVAAGGGLAETVAGYLAHAGSLEATARALYVHPNTVRYRLRRAADVTGYAATDPRDAFALHIAMVLGQLGESAQGAKPL
jgi:DNA-binding PucR family transcriptional regulator